MTVQAPDTWQRIVVLSRDDYNRARVTSPRLLADPLTRVVALPLRPPDSEDPALLTAADQLRPSVVLLRNAWGGSGYVDAVAAYEVISLAKFNVFANVCQMLGATRLEVKEIHEESSRGRIRGRAAFSGQSVRGKSSLKDLSPLKGMRLVSLNMSGTGVSDLTPLKGMELEYLWAMDTAVSDLATLRGMPLTHLDLHGTQGVTSIGMLEGMPLEYLNLTELKVADLSALRGMTTLRRLVLAGTPVADLAAVKDLKLTELSIQRTGVSDLSPLQGMELRQFLFTPKNTTKGLEFIRTMQSLTTIGVGNNQHLPAAEFWERYDKGEFKE